MAEAKQGNGCPRCAELAARVAALEAELAAAKKHSGNSSKPPSSDIVKPPPRKGKRGRSKKRKRGGQPGHPRHERPPFAAEELDQHWLWFYDACPCCGGTLQDAPQPPRQLQQVEIPVFPAQIVQHDSQPQHCARCQKTFVPPLPEELRRAGLAGPRLTALVGFLKGACHMSFSAIRKYFRDVVGVKLSRGLLRKLVGKVSAALADPYDALLAMLPRADRLHVDETGHKENGQRLWTWCFRAYLYTVYKISPSRGSDVLVADLKKLFGVIHRRDQYASEQTFRRALAAARDQLVWDATLESPHTRQALALEERFYQHTESYFRFLTEPDVDPTNNLAEQALRFVAIHRRITQGTRGEEGRRWCERIWTAIQTCGQQDRSLFEFLCAAVTAHFRSEPAPCLAPNTS